MHNVLLPTCILQTQLITHQSSTVAEEILSQYLLRSFPLQMNAISSLNSTTHIHFYQPSQATRDTNPPPQATREKAFGAVGATRRTYMVWLRFWIFRCIGHFDLTTFVPLLYLFLSIRAHISQLHAFIYINTWTSLLFYVIWFKFIISPKCMHICLSSRPARPPAPSQRPMPQPPPADECDESCNEKSSDEPPGGRADPEVHVCIVCVRPS